MAQKRSKISHFWQELKRRRVVHVITVYASASFVLIELVNNLAEPLNLPDKLATIVVVILAVGFPLAIILAWIYDLTPEGIEKTKTAEETTSLRLCLGTDIFFHAIARGIHCSITGDFAL